jgi:hypothetical protein
MCVYVWGILISWWGKPQPYFNRLLHMLRNTHSIWKCVWWTCRQPTTRRLVQYVLCHPNHSTITRKIQSQYICRLKSSGCMLHTVLVNAGLEHTRRRFAPILQATTTENLRVKDAFGLNLESQPIAQYIHGNNTGTKHQLVHVCTCIHTNYSSLVMSINEPSPGRIIRTFQVIYWMWQLLGNLN